MKQLQSIEQRKHFYFFCQLCEDGDDVWKEEPQILLKFGNIFRPIQKGKYVII